MFAWKFPCTLSQSRKGKAWGLEKQKTHHQPAGFPCWPGGCRGLKTSERSDTTAEHRAGEGQQPRGVLPSPCRHSGSSTSLQPPGRQALGPCLPCRVSNFPQLEPGPRS